jgi:hypothetical protein
VGFIRIPGKDDSGYCSEYSSHTSENNTDNTKIISESILEGERDDDFRALRRWRVEDDFRAHTRWRIADDFRAHKRWRKAHKSWRRANRWRRAGACRRSLRWRRATAYYWNLTILIGGCMCSTHHQDKEEEAEVHHRMIDNSEIVVCKKKIRYLSVSYFLKSRVSSLKLPISF